MEEKYIVVIGSMNYDVLFKQQRLPMKGETYTADSVSFCGGGKGANQAVQCAKLGIKTYMVAKTGEDSFGDFLRSELVKYGVDTTYVGKSERTTGYASVNALTDGSVYATITEGANGDFTPADIDRLDDLIKNSAAIVLQLEIPVPVVEYIIEKAASFGVYILLNAAPAKPIRPEILKKVDCLVVNEPESTFYAGVTISDKASAEANYQQLLSKVKDTLVITLGKYGSLLCEQAGTTYFPADHSVKVVETTGAGDSYIGAFAVQKVLGKDNKEACAYASRVSQVTVTKIGAQPAMPTLAEMGE